MIIYYIVTYAILMNNFLNNIFTKLSLNFQIIIQFLLRSYAYTISTMNKLFAYNTTTMNSYICNTLKFITQNCTI